MRPFTRHLRDAAELMSRSPGLLLLLVGTSLFMLAFLTSLFDWLSNAYLHVSLEIAATALGLFIATISLTRFQATDNARYLLIGTAFLGTALLDAYHAYATSDLLHATVTERLWSTSIWSWSFGRLFLAAVLLASASERIRLRVQRLGTPPVLLLALAYAVFAILVVEFLPLPSMGSADDGVQRPIEYLGGLLFLAAAIAYLWKRNWREDPFVFWLVVGLLCSAASNMLFIAYSARFHDEWFDVGHVVKVAAYVAVVAGVLASLKQHFRELHATRLQLELQSRELSDRGARLSSMLNDLPFAVFQADPEGRIVFVNATWSRITALHEETSLGNGWKQLIAPEERDRIEQAWTACLASASSFDQEFACRDGERSYWVRMHAEPLTDQSGRLVGYLGTLEDITLQRELARVKNEFVSTVSHELRTPLTAIRGSLNIVMHEGRDRIPEDLQPMLDIANNNSERLALLVNDILDMEKIEAGRMEFHLQLVKLHDLVAEMLRDNRPFADKFGVSLEVGKLPKVSIYTDPHRVQQVLANLLSNACKFSLTEGVVYIDLERQASSVLIGITDHGPGIPANMQSRIFEKFMQASNNGMKSPSGTGLGLYISRELARKLGGELRFVSEPGRTRFELELPINPPDLE